MYIVLIENTKKDLSKEFKNTKCTKRRRILMELDSEEDSNDEYNPGILFFKTLIWKIIIVFISVINTIS